VAQFARIAQYAAAARTGIHHGTGRRQTISLSEAGEYADLYLAISLRSFRLGFHFI
jgi:hypothetical protein